MLHPRHPADVINGLLTCFSASRQNWVYTRFIPVAILSTLVISFSFFLIDYSLKFIRNIVNNLLHVLLRPP